MIEIPSDKPEVCHGCLFSNGCARKNCKALERAHADRMFKEIPVVGTTEDLEDPETFNDMLDHAQAHAEAERLVDPELSTPKYWHRHSLVVLCAQGILNADPWYKGYALPPDFEGVMNRIAQDVQNDPPKDVNGNDDSEVLCVSINDLRQWFRDHLHAILMFNAWGESDVEKHITSRYSNTPDERDGIDLIAVMQNITVALRNEERLNDIFEAKYERERRTGKPFEHADLISLLTQ